MIKTQYILIFSLIIILILLSMTKRYKLFEEHRDDKIYYFDNNATTFIQNPTITEEICKWLNCGNPSNNLHIAGITSKDEIETCRKNISQDLNVDAKEILFTSGATEANNMLIQGTVNNYLDTTTDKCTIITSNFEHASVLNVFKGYESNPRVNVVFVKIKNNPSDEYYGSIDPNDIEYAIKNAPSNVILLSIMYANNEIGSVQNISEIGNIAKKYNIFFHSDATQAIGKYIIHPKKLGIDAMSFSGHKFHAPKGIGCLFKTEKCKIKHLCFGGEQENEERPGTENVAFIAGISKALTFVHENREEKNKKLLRQRNMIKRNLVANGISIIEPNKEVLSNTLLVMLRGIDTCNKNFARMLSSKYHICVGVSSACQTKKNSHVLEALNITGEDKDKIIRISLSDYTSDSECEYLVKNMLDLFKNHKL